MTGIELKNRRKTIGLTQVELAALWGVRQKTISSWETEFVKMQHPIILDLAMRYLERQVHTDTFERAVLPDA